MEKKAVALLSGGLDSVTAAAIVARQGYRIYALTVSYGQRHFREIDSARLLAEWLDAVRHEVIELPISELLRSALTEIESNVEADQSAIGKCIPPTYVPARNTILLSMALAWSESLDADAVVIGANSIDYSGYPDCRPEFLEAFQTLISVATKKGVEGHRIRLFAPLINMSKADIVRKAVELAVPIEKTWSCYRGGEKPCGVCESCLLRQRGFESAGIRDPATEG
jgi:7-cyano-7-deazaguanine synthase